MERLWLITASLLFFCLGWNVAEAQYYLEPKSEFKVEYYPKNSRDFQAQSYAAGQIVAGYDFSDNLGIGVRFGLDITRHLKNESKMQGSPLQTEATKVMEFRREAILSMVYYPDWGEIWIGGWIGRRSAHWLDRDCNCYFNDFPKEDGSAKEVMESLREGDKHPGIAYHDGLRPYLKIEVSDYNLTVEAQGPAYRWHTVTLPYSSWNISVEQRYSDVKGGDLIIGNKSGLGGLTEYSSDGYAYFAPIPELEVGVHFGRIPYPGYQQPLNRFSFSLKISLSKRYKRR